MLKRTIITSRFALFMALALFSCTQNNNPIYQSADFSIYPDRVIQGNYTAFLNSDGNMVSNFVTPLHSVTNTWASDSALSDFPQYKSSYPILNAIYKLSANEIKNQIIGDSIFAGQAEQSRKLSYASILSLALTHPQICMKSLLQHVKNDRIIQDSGAGGAWPVNSDRILWAAAAWEIYKSTGDSDWLRQTYFIIKNSIDDDLNVIWDYKHHLFKGEASFLSWDKQSYPDWMSPVDVYETYSFANQINHYIGLQALIKMGELIDKDVQKYVHISAALKNSINNKFWIKEKNRYGKFLYRHAKTISHNTDKLGSSLAGIWNISTFRNKEIDSEVITKYGVPYIYPLLPNQLSEKNIWPFVQGFWNWAMAQNKNMEAIRAGLSCSIRTTALNLGNPEYFSMTDGKTKTAKHDLLSASASLSNYFHVLLGMKLTNEQLEFNPAIPREFKGRQYLNGFVYRNAILDIQILGFGNRIRSFTFDGIPYREAVVPKDIEGKHKIVIEMNNQVPVQNQIKITEAINSPQAPVISFRNNQLEWNKIESANHYKVYQNGELLLKTKDHNMTDVSFNEPVEYCIEAVDSLGEHSYLSKPLVLFASKYQKFLEAEAFQTPTKSKYVVLKKKDKEPFYFQVKAPREGSYYISFLYANGNGDIDKGNSCVTRSFWLNNGYLGSIVFPQRGLGNWNDFGYSNTFLVDLKKGYNFFKISYEEFNNNMNGEHNAVRIDKIRLLRKY